MSKQSREQKKRIRQEKKEARQLKKKYKRLIRQTRKTRHSEVSLLRGLFKDFYLSKAVAHLLRVIALVIALFMVAAVWYGLKKTMFQVNGTFWGGKEILSRLISGFKTAAPILAVLAALLLLNLIASVRALTATRTAAAAAVIIGAMISAVFLFSLVIAVRELSGLVSIAYQSVLDEQGKTRLIVLGSALAIVLAAAICILLVKKTKKTAVALLGAMFGVAVFFTASYINNTLPESASTDTVTTGMDLVMRVFILILACILAVLIQTLLSKNALKAAAILCGAGIGIICLFILACSVHEIILTVIMAIAVETILLGMNLVLPKAVCALRPLSPKSWLGCITALLIYAAALSFCVLFASVGLITVNYQTPTPPQSDLKTNVAEIIAQLGEEIDVGEAFAFSNIKSGLTELQTLTPASGLRVNAEGERWSEYWTAEKNSFSCEGKSITLSGSRLPEGIAGTYTYYELYDLMNSNSLTAEMFQDADLPDGDVKADSFELMLLLMAKARVDTDPGVYPEDGVLAEMLQAYAEVSVEQAMQTFFADMPLDTDDPDQAICEQLEEQLNMLEGELKSYLDGTPDEDDNALLFCSTYQELFTYWDKKQGEWDKGNAEDKGYHKALAEKRAEFCNTIMEALNSRYTDVLEQKIEVYRRILSDILETPACLEDELLLKIEDGWDYVWLYDTYDTLDAKLFSVAANEEDYQLTHEAAKQIYDGIETLSARFTYLGYLNEARNALEDAAVQIHPECASEMIEYLDPGGAQQTPDTEYAQRWSNALNDLMTAQNQLSLAQAMEGPTEDTLTEEENAQLQTVRDLYEAEQGEKRSASGLTQELSELKHQYYARINPMLRAVNIIREAQGGALFQVQFVLVCQLVGLAAGIAECWVTGAIRFHAWRLNRKQKKLGNRKTV